MRTSGFSRILMVMLAGVILPAIPGCGGGANSYSISGTVALDSGVPLSGVSLTVNYLSTQTTMTDMNGDYSFNYLSNGSFTITPVLAGYSFMPASRTVSLSWADAPNNNFTAVASTVSYGISGTVTMDAGGTLSGVTVTLSGSNTGTATAG